MSDRPVPLGNPIPLTDQDLIELSQVTPADIQKAKAFWRAHVSEKFKTLLDAPLMEDQEDAANRPNQ